MKKSKSAKSTTYKTIKTPKKFFYTGGASDEHIPHRALTLLAAHKVDTPDFIEWLSRELGRYRDFCKFDASIPGGSDQATIMTGLANRMDEVRKGIGYQAIPPHGEAIANESMYRVRGEFFFDVVHRLERDLLTASVYLRHAAGHIVEQWPTAGRRTDSLRDALLDRLVSRLQAEDGFDKFEVTCLIACEILDDGCGIRCPKTMKAAAARVRDYRKGA